jgi:hypothetical protein
VDDEQDEPVRRDWGDRLNIAYNRTWEWRDALGCLWLPGLFVILSVAILLGRLGVPALLLQIGTVAAIIGLLISFWRISRSRTKV